MKNIIPLALAASLAIGASARHSHGHRHLIKKHIDEPELQKRAVSTVTVTGPVVTVYEIDGELISGDEASEGIARGDYIVVGESSPTPIVIEKPSETSEASALSEGGRFMEQKVDTTTTAQAAPPTSTTASPSPSASSVSSQSSSYDTGSITTPFKSDTYPCSQFPSSFGPIEIGWMNMSGWSGIQKAPEFKWGDVSIDLVVTGINGDTCEPGDFCSYACPPGYQKTQWPLVQSADLKSIGGLYCNSKGKLELTREDYPVLCEKGVGGVTIQNDLTEQVSTCRTDYPGTECMVVPLLSPPGSTVDLTNPDQTTYYVWNKKTTSAQYYVNLKGLSPEQACVWKNPDYPTSAGNYSPLNIGTSRNAEGLTFLGLFPNTPSSTAPLDFNIEITGDGIIGDCYYKNGAFPPGYEKGCTATIPKGKSAVIRYY